MTNNKLKSHVICQKVTSALENQPSKHGKDKRETREGAGITRLHQEGAHVSLTRAVLPLPWRAEFPLRAASFSQHSLEPSCTGLTPTDPASTQACTRPSPSPPELGLIHFPPSHHPDPAGSPRG